MGRHEARFLTASRLHLHSVFPPAVQSGSCSYHCHKPFRLTELLAHELNTVTPQEQTKARQLDTLLFILDFRNGKLMGPQGLQMVARKIFVRPLTYTNGYVTYATS
ncbi:hypothetical protein [Oryza sativa Japonica Group]|uniref:Uncharacterized protein n=1 Tax=Oryza sativa subsp. japonica TaxID=39947 RepID=Q8LJB7_ORYSJ|nr:hypothetical protein [Oryza sativa Japonica Group]